MCHVSQYLQTELRVAVLLCLTSRGHKSTVYRTPKMFYKWQEDSLCTAADVSAACYSRLKSFLLSDRWYTGLSARPTDVQPRKVIRYYSSICTRVCSTLSITLRSDQVFFFIVTFFTCFYVVLYCSERRCICDFLVS